MIKKTRSQIEARKRIPNEVFKILEGCDTYWEFRNKTKFNVL